MFFQIKILFFSISLVLFFGGCSTEEETNSKTYEPTQKTIEVSGIVGKGRITAGKVELFDVNNAKLGETTSFDDEGRYTIEIAAYSGKIRASAVLSVYLDEALQDLVYVDNLAISTLSTIGLEDTTVNITPITDLAYRLLGGDEGIEKSSELIAKTNIDIGTILGIDGDKNPSKIDTVFFLQDEGEKIDTPTNRNAIILTSISKSTDLTLGEGSSSANVEKVRIVLDSLYNSILQRDMPTLKDMVQKDNTGVYILETEDNKVAIKDSFEQLEFHGLIDAAPISEPTPTPTPTPTITFEITSDSNITQNENTTIINHNIGANMDIASYSIVGGMDSSYFDIDSSSGDLSFKDFKDFENSIDLDHDNIYEVKVEITSSNDKLASQTIKVEVVDVAENIPSIASETITLDEDSTTTITTLLDNDGTNGTHDYISIISVSTVSPDMQILSFTQNSITIKTLNNSTTTQSFSYTISNGEYNATTTNTVVITDTNDAPTGTIPDQEITLDTSRTFNVKNYFSDIDNNNNPNTLGWRDTDFTSFSFSSTPSWIGNINTTTGTFSISPTSSNASSGDSVTVAVTSTDKAGISISDSFVINIIESLTITSINSNKTHIAPNQTATLSVNLSKQADINLDADDLSIVLTDGTNNITVTNSNAISQTNVTSFDISYTFPTTYTQTTAEQGINLTIKSIAPSDNKIVDSSNNSLNATYIDGTTNMTLDTKISDFSSTWEFGDPRYLTTSRQKAFVNLKFNEPVWFDTTDYNNSSVLVDNKTPIGTVTTYESKDYYDEYNLDISLTTTSSTNTELADQRIYLGSFRDRSGNIYNTNSARVAPFVIDTKAPTITSASLFDVNENSTDAFSVTATDVSEVVYTTDSAEFDLNSSTGKVTFVTSPDYESGTTSYSLTVKATDIYDNVSTQDVTVNILDIYDSIKATGQTKSYTTGDDGTYQKGDPVSYTRDATTKIVTDNLTKLQWQGAAIKVTKDWAGAVGHCEDLELGGQTDWRLPSMKELEDTVFFGKGKQHLFHTAFGEPTRSSNDRFWTSTAGLSGHLTYVFRYGEALNRANAEKMIRCVRGDETVYSTVSFTKSATNNIVVDNVKNKEWQDNESVSKNWKDAIAYCEDLSLDNKDDWRLPNIAELLTIVEYSKSPAIDNTFTKIANGKYWSSTKNPRAGSFVFDFKNKLSSYERNGNHSVRCIRDR